MLLGCGVALRQAQVHPLGASAAALTAKSQSASDNESEAVYGNGGLGEADAETDPYSLPVSHEVALEGVS